MAHLMVGRRCGRRGEPIGDQALTAAGKGAAVRLQLSLGIGLVLFDAPCGHGDNF